MPDDAEWAVLQPLVQRPATPQGGRPPKHPLRAGHRRDLLPGALGLRLAAAAPRLPAAGHGVPVVAKWAADGTLARIHDVLRRGGRVQDRDAARPLLWRLRVADSEDSNAQA